MLIIIITQNPILVKGAWFWHATSQKSPIVTLKNRLKITIDIYCVFVGSYVYFPSAVAQGGRATLMSPALTGPGCLRFAYYMYNSFGQASGQLNINVGSNGNMASNPIWSGKYTIK